LSVRKAKTRICQPTSALPTWVLDNLRENVEYAKHTNVANRALELIGKEIGMFVEKRDVRHVAEFEKLSDLELLQLIERETRKLLEDNSGGAGDAGEEGGEGSAEGEDDHGGD
jgi:hypothetical protein